MEITTESKIATIHNNWFWRLLNGMCYEGAEWNTLAHLSLVCEGSFDKFPEWMYKNVAVRNDEIVSGLGNDFVKKLSWFEMEDNSGNNVWVWWHYQLENALDKFMFLGERPTPANPFEELLLKIIDY